MGNNSPCSRTGTTTRSCEAHDAGHRLQPHSLGAHVVALGYSGPEDPGAVIKHSKNVRVVNCKDVVSSHGGYRSSGQVWAYRARS